jgi:hypothetical protein
LQLRWRGDNKAAMDNFEISIFNNSSHLEKNSKEKPGIYVKLLLAM